MVLRARRNLTVKLYDEQKGRCYYCGKQMNLGPLKPAKMQKDPLYATLDHFYPKHMKEERAAQRKVVSCYRCNNKKGDTDPFEFIERMKNGKSN